MNLAFILVLFFIFISNFAVTAFLVGKTERKNINLVSALIMIPVIPLFWLYANSQDQTGIFFSLYAPIFITILYVAMLLIRIKKVIKT
ncbi:hypothetical protein [Salinicoccus sp. HZC-1]|uniref:hypothetical protein n=1 Tax=Salinicoccus sp. HZC-1 TaxID=3385497 RepID=UPI00398A7F44